MFQERIVTKALPPQALCGVRQRRLWSRWAQSQSAFFEERFLTGKGMLVSSTVLAFTVIKSNLEGFVAQRPSDASFMHVHTIHMEPGCNRHKWCCLFLFTTSLTISCFIRKCSCFWQGHWVCAYTSRTVECLAGLLLLQTFWFQVAQYSRMSQQKFL